MRLTGGRGVRWTLVFAVCCGGGCGGSRYETPETTFETAKAAVTSYDCAGFCACLTHEARDETAAELIMFRGLIQLAALIGGPEAERARLRAEKIEVVLQKHGFNDETAPRIAAYLAAGPEQRRQRIVELVEPIKDRTAFIGDFFRVLIETADQPDVKLVEPDARLVDLKIESDTATATFTQTREGQERTGPIEFEKVEGEWKISRFPLRQLVYPSRSSSRS